MATSGTYSFSVSRDDIIRQALLNIKRLDPHESPTATETADCSRVLNMMCKQWMGKSDFAPGLKVWSRKRGYMLLSNTGVYTIGVAQSGWTNALATITKLSVSGAAAAPTVTPTSVVGMAAAYNIAIALASGAMFYTTIVSVLSGVVTLTAPLPSAASAGAAVYCYQSTAQNPTALETALLRDGDYSDTPLRLMTVQTYDQLPNKADPYNIGDPTALLYEEGVSTTAIRLDVGRAQDLSKYLVLTYMEPVQDFVNPLDTPYYPQQWYLALCWGLSEQVSPMFGANWTDKMENLKNIALQIARNHSAENTEIYFQPGAED